MGLTKEEFMRTQLIPLGLAVGLSAAFVANAGAVPAGATSVKEAAAASSPLQKAQYAEYRTRRGHLVKCYRDFVIGPYRCHWFPL
jgi:hypothetical protein